MILKNIDVNEFLIGFDDRFNVESNDWIPRSNKWILKGISLISNNILYNPIAANINFTDNHIHLPVDIKVLQGISYNGLRLVPIDYAPLAATTTEIDESETYYLLGNVGDNPLDFVVDPSDRPIEVKPPTIVSMEGKQGYINPASRDLKMFTYTVMRNDIIKINVPETEGTVILFYKSLPYELNQDGSVNMLIPDNEWLIDALEWYVLTRLIGRGYKHHTFNYQYADAEWTKSRKQARKAVAAMSEDQREKASQVFRNFLVDTDKWYNLG